MGSLFRSASTFERKWTIRLALGGAITCTQHFANERTCTVGVWGLRNYVELCLCEWAAMGDVCRLSWQPSERRAIRRVFFFSPPLVWLTARDSLSVWTVSLKDERHYHERMQGVHAPVLTATWQTVLSGALRGSTFETCSLFFLERLLSKPDLRL